ncbi:MAG: TFIIB-type zinc ribbon-containing protein [Vulcanisaeta sp.]
MECPYCGSSRIIERDGQYVCIDCGSVLGSVYVYDTYTQASPLLDSEEVDLSPIWRSVEKTIKKNVNVRLSIYRRLRAINERFRIRRESYSIYRAFECMEFIARSFNIDDRYVEEAKSIFRKIINTDNSATYYQVAVAAMLYVILAHNLPVSTKLVINACRSRGHKLTFESIRDSLMAMGIKYSVRDRILSHIRVGLGKLFGDSWVTIYPYAEEALGKLRKSTIQSRSPLTLAAAIVYCVGKRYSHNLKIEDVARVMQVSPYTLRGYVNNLCKDITK